MKFLVILALTSAASAFASIPQTKYACIDLADKRHSYTIALKGDAVKVEDSDFAGDWMTGDRKLDYKPRGRDQGAQLFEGFPENGADCAMSLLIDSKLAARANSGRAVVRCRADDFQQIFLACRKTR